MYVGLRSLGTCFPHFPVNKKVLESLAGNDDIKLKKKNLYWLKWYPFILQMIRPAQQEPLLRYNISPFLSLHS